VGDRLLAIVGAGEMGRSALAILLQDDPTLRLRVFDRSSAALREAAGADPQRVECRTVGTDHDEPLDLQGCALVLNFAGPFYAGRTPAAARSALEHGCGYVDICDDAEGTQALLDLDREVRAAGLSFVSGAGLSPGLTNLLAKRVVEEAPACDGIQVAWATRERDPGGLAPLRHMLHMAVSSSPQWQDGRMASTPGFVPETARAYRFPEPVGEIECYDTAHPEPMLLSRSFGHLRNVTCQGATLPHWANAAFSAVARLGFGDPTLTVAIDGAELDPQEFLWRLLWARHDRRPGREVVDLGAIQVVGWEGERPVVRMSLVDRSSMSRSTGVGAVTIALSMLEQDLAPGVHGPEALDAQRAFAILDRLRAATGAFADGPVVERHPELLDDRALDSASVASRSFMNAR
jgi:saccharopine dehydrogenase-like NADP-dependent oxidoreductase